MKKLFSAIVVLFLTIGLSLPNGNYIHGQGVSEAAAPNVNSDKNLADLEFNPSIHPDNYVNVNQGKVALSKEDQALLAKQKKDRFWADYANLDGMGRGQDVKALVTYQSVLTHSSAYLKQHGLLYGDKRIYERPPFPSYVHVAGEYEDGQFDPKKQTWKGKVSHNKQVQFKNGSKGWFYNKSHTLAWSLGGNMETRNVTLGTRAQNVGKGQTGGMGHAESIVRKAVEKNQNAKVFYHAKPLYKGNELVPRGTHVRAYSVNDQGKTVNLNIWVFNAQDGFAVDYFTGAFSKAS